MKKYHMYLEYFGEGPCVGCVEYDAIYEYDENDEVCGFYAKRVWGNKDLQYCIDMLDRLLHNADLGGSVSKCLYGTIEQVKAIFEERIQYILQNTYEDVEFIGIKDENGNFSFRKPREEN